MATSELDLGAFFAERAERHKKYVSTCIHLAGKVIDALKARLGVATLATQALKAAPNQGQISPNGVLQENGVAVFAYAVDVEAHPLPPHALTFFLSAGAMAGKEGDHWFVGHEKENFVLPRGGEPDELAPVVAHIMSALRAAICTTYPTEARESEAKAGEKATTKTDEPEKTVDASDGAKAEKTTEATEKATAAQKAPSPAAA